MGTNTELLSQQIILKANISDVYIKSQIWSLLDPLAHKENYYDKGEIDVRHYLDLSDLVDNLQNYYYKDSNLDDN